MAQIVFQVVDDGLIKQARTPEFWKAYRTAILLEITQKAMARVQSNAARLWRHPTAGGLDQSWFSSVDESRGVGTIWNAKPYAYWLNYGVRPHHMRYLLLNSNNAFALKDGTLGAVIPMRIWAGGRARTIFRTITEKHLLGTSDLLADLPAGETPKSAGAAWFHKGYVGRKFLEDGLKQYADQELQADYEGIKVNVFRRGGL